MHLLLCLVFFLSGATALVFETLWFRVAGLTFGNSVWASSIVLSSLMAGLALGSLLIGRYGARVRRPLWAYAVLEMVIGTTGFGLVLLFPVLTELLSPLFRPFLDTHWVLHPLRVLIAFALLLVPSTAMGATLPLLASVLSPQDGNFGRVLGRLYGWNTLGAVGGALVAEFVLIGPLGLRGAGLFAVVLNVIAAVFIVLLAKRFREAGREPAAVGPRKMIAGNRRLIAVAFLSGGVLLGIEVVWFRFMLLFNFGTSRLFALMLASILGGIALGGFAASWWLRYRPKAYRQLPAVALLSGAVVCFMYFSFADSMGLLSAVPVSFLSGILFTFVGRALEDEIDDERIATASLTFANTLGAMFGALVAGFALLPWLGIEASFLALAFLYGVVAFLYPRPEALHAVGEAAPEAENEWARLARRVALFGFVLTLVLFPHGLMRRHHLPRVLAPYLQDGSRVIAMDEGVTEAAFYLEKDLFGLPRSHRLVTNGFSMSATTYQAKRYMRLFVYLPMALRPEAQRALLISYGIGVTAQALVEQKNFQSIDVVDISQNVVDLSREVNIFSARHPLDDPRVKVHIEDGRFFLQTTDREFDLITGEPPPPKNAGVVNLYTKEYFQLVHDRLAPQGIATYWLPVSQLELAETKGIIKSFCLAFLDCSLWTGSGTEWMLTGTRDLEGPIPADDFERPWREEVAWGLESIGIERPEQLGALFLADATFLARWVGDSRPIEDNYPQGIETALSPGVESTRERNRQYWRLMEVQAAKERFRESEWIRRIWPSEVRSKTFDYFDYQAFINQTIMVGGQGVPELHRVLTRSRLRALPLLLMESDEDDAVILTQAVAAGVSDPRLDFMLAARAFAAFDYREASLCLARARALHPQDRELAQFQILALHLMGEEEQAAAVAKWLRETPGARDQRFWAWLEANLEVDGS